jgi:hypothetical protein
MLFPSTSKGAQRKGARDVRTYTHILLKHQLEKRDLQTLKEPRVGKFKRTKSISLSLLWVLWSDIKSVHQSEPPLTADASGGYSPPGGDLPHWSRCRVEKGFFLMPLLPQQPHLQFLKSQPPTYLYT